MRLLKKKDEKIFKQFSVESIKYNKVAAWLFVVLFAGMGIKLLVGTRAVSPYLSIQSSSGQIIGPAQTVNNNSATNGVFVKFGSGFVTRSGNSLYLDGQKYQFSGINAYELATYYGGNGSCGAMSTDQQLNDFFASLTPYSVVRTWAFQGSMGIDVNTKQINWTYLDRVVNAATTHNIKLILAIGNEDGTCDDSYYHDSAWYNGGFMNIHNNSQGTAPLAYWNYMQDLVTHYSNNPTIAMWEPINEPEAFDCSNSALGSGCDIMRTCNEAVAQQALLNFFNVVGAKIKQLDPNHLISSGLIGSGQCGAAGADYLAINNNPYIDVASYHDYGSDTVAIPGDQYNGLELRINEMASINKPLMVGESGIEASDVVNGCTTLVTRSSEFQTKLTAMFAQKIVGFLPWDWVPNPSTTACSYDIGSNDPDMKMLANYAFKMQ